MGKSFQQVDFIVFGDHSQVCSEYSNSNFEESLHNLKKECINEADFLHLDKHQTFLQVHATNIGGQEQSCPKYSK